MLGPGHPPPLFCTGIVVLYEKTFYCTHNVSENRNSRSKENISVALYNIKHTINPFLLCLLQEKCTHPEDVKLCTVIVKTNGSMPAKNKKTVCVLVLFFCMHMVINSCT